MHNRCTLLHGAASRGLMLALLATLTSGCLTATHGQRTVKRHLRYVPGAAVNITEGPQVVGERNGKPPKQGKSCAMNIIGAVAFGDNSIIAARNAGAITQVATVDYEFIGVGGYFFQVCTIVRGS